MQATPKVTVPLLAMGYDDFDGDAQDVGITFSESDPSALPSSLMRTPRRRNSSSDGDDDEIEWVNFEQDINDARLRCGIIRFTSNKLEHWYCRYHLQKFRQTYNSVYLLLSGSALIYMLWDVLEHYVNLDDDYEQFNLHSSEWVFLTFINLTEVALFALLYCVLRWVHKCNIKFCSHTLLWQLVCSASWIVVRAVHMRLWALTYDARLDSMLETGHSRAADLDNTTAAAALRGKLRVLGTFTAGIHVGMSQVLVVILSGLRSPFAIPAMFVLLMDFAVESALMLRGDSLPAILRLLMATVVLSWISYRMDITQRTHFLHTTRLKQAKIATELEVDPFSVDNLAIWMGLKQKPANCPSSIERQINESFLRDSKLPTTNLRTNLRDAFKGMRPTSSTHGVAKHSSKAPGVAKHSNAPGVAMNQLSSPSFKRLEHIDTQLESFRLSPVVEGEDTKPPSVLADWEIDFGKLAFLEKIGAGGGGQVWKAKLGLGDQFLVAVKQVFSTLQVTRANMESALEEFSREVSILRQLAHHPNITRLFGICQHQQSGSIFFVTEWCDGGALGDVLVDPNRRPNGVSTKEDIRVVVEIASQVSAALVYLHGKNILHGDLKPMNVLLSSHAPIGAEGGGRVLLCDFGLATKIGDESDDDAAAKSVMRTSIFMSPEILAGGSAYLSSASWDMGCKTDVYAFGILMAAVVTLNKPFKDLRGTANMRATMQVVEKIKAKPHLRPDLPAHCPALLRKLMQRCWAEPHARLSMKGVEALVHDIRAMSLAGNLSPSMAI